MINILQYRGHKISLERIAITTGSRPNLKGICEVAGLKFLQLNDIRYLDPEFYKSLDLETMEELAIVNMNITTESFMSLANRKCPKLKNICLHEVTTIGFELNENALKRMISNSPELKMIHVMDIVLDFTCEQLCQLEYQTGVSIGVSYERGKPLDYYTRRKQLRSLTHCDTCGYIRW